MQVITGRSQSCHRGEFSPQVQRRFVSKSKCGSESSRKCLWQNCHLRSLLAARVVFGEKVERIACIECRQTHSAERHEHALRLRLEPRQNCCSNFLNSDSLTPSARERNAMLKTTQTKVDAPAAPVSEYVTAWKIAVVLAALFGLARHRKPNLVQPQVDTKNMEVIQQLKTIRSLLIILTSACIYSLMYTFSLYDSDLFSDRQLTLIPPIPISISVISFLYTFSSIVFILHLYLLVAIHGDNRSLSNAKETDKENLRGEFFFANILSSYFSAKKSRSLRSMIDYIISVNLIWTLPSLTISVMSYKHSVLSSKFITLFYLILLFIESAICLYAVLRSSLRKLWKFILFPGFVQSLYFIFGTAILTWHAPSLLCVSRSNALADRPDLTTEALDATCNTFGRLSRAQRFVLGNAIQHTWLFANGASLTVSLTPVLRIANWTHRRLSHYSNDMGAVDGPNSHLDGPILNGVTMRDSQIFAAFMKGSILDSVDLVGLRAIGVDLSQSEVIASNISLATFVSSSLEDTNFNGTVMFGTNFRNTKLNRARIQSSVLMDNDFSNAEMHCAFISDNVVAGSLNFTDADLSDAVFSSQNLRNAKFDGANLSDACLLSGEEPTVVLSTCKVRDVIAACPNLADLFPSSIRSKATSDISHQSHSPTGM